MANPPQPFSNPVGAPLASFDAAPQHGPRPLPLFIDMVRSIAAGQPEHAAAVLAGLRRYQVARRTAPPPPRPVLARAGRAVVRDYGKDGNPPVLFVPSLINLPNVLDLDEETSLLRWLATQGLRPLLLDWGTPGAEERDLSIAAHVEHMLLPVLDSLAASSGTPITLAGYCLGGTMAIAAAALRPVRGVALIAAPWRFAGYPDRSREGLAALWETTRPFADTTGLLPMEVLQSAFWRLDPARTLDKYARFGTLDPQSAAARRFVTLEDWANDGPPLPFAAARELIEDLFGRDVTGGGSWRVGGAAIGPEALDCPVLDIASTTDRIVPRASAAGIGRRMALAQGHVGMIVGARARDRLWEPLAEWLAHPHAN